MLVTYIFITIMCLIFPRSPLPSTHNPGEADEATRGAGQDAAGEVAVDARHADPAQEEGEA